MRNNWRQEPILEFDFMTIGGSVQELDDEGKPCGEKTYSESITFGKVDLEEYWHDALFWYKKAALQYEPLAVQLLRCVIDFNNVKRKALAGDKDAQFRLSVYYHDSYGTSLNLYKSAEWLRKAALNGSKEAIASIKDWNRWTKSRQKLTDKDFYAEPGMVPDDYEHLYMIERHGRIEKQYVDRTHLDVLWEKFSKLDFEETEILAMTGDPEKQYQLAWMYDWGLGVQQDMKEAIKWFVEAAFNQYAPAQTELGIMYQYGIMATTCRLEVFDGKNVSNSKNVT